MLLLRHAWTDRGLGRGLVFAVAAVAALLLAGCGAGGLDARKPGAPPAALAESGPARLAITTAAVPAGSVGVPFPPTRLAAAGARGALAWHLTGGALPPGMTLTVDGRLIGAPQAQGRFPFAARVEDGVQADTRSFVLAVDVLALQVTGGLTFGDAWSDALVTLQALGATDAHFDLVHDESGGRLAAQGATATYLPGPRTSADTPALDRIRVTDRTTGRTAEIALPVHPNPIAEHVAAFGTTDVWYVDFEQKHGLHANRTDWQRALTHLGLRARGSTGAVETPADRLAELVTRRAVLRHLDAMFLRREDGALRSDGLAVSLPFARPVGFTCPAPGHWLPGSPDGYSVLAICERAGPGRIGAAITDGPDNALHVHNAPGGIHGDLGVFVNRLLGNLRLTYGTRHRSLEAHPIDADDVPALSTLLYDGDLTAFGARGDDIAYVVEALGRSVASVVAHEIGHSVGLDHTATATVGSLMNSGIAIHPAIAYHFVAEDVARLRTSLPGRGRQGEATGGAAAHGQAAAWLGPLHDCGCAGH